MNYDNLTADQLKRLSECESAEEAMSYIREEGIQLTDEQLETISGGSAASIWKTIKDGFENAWDLIRRKRN